MHSKAVVCHMCCQKFFPASLKFHVKVCATKQEHIKLPCDFCQKIFSYTALQVHMGVCRRRASRKLRTPTKDGDVAGCPHRRQLVGLRRHESAARHAAKGGSGNNMSDERQRRQTPEKQQISAASQRRENFLESNESVTTSLSLISTNNGSIDRSRDENHGSEYSTKEEGVDGPLDTGGCRRYIADSRVACSNCHRNFSPDRVGVHEEICQRVNSSKEDTRGRRMRKTAHDHGRPMRSSCPAFRHASGKKSGRHTASAHRSRFQRQQDAHCSPAEAFRPLTPRESSEQIATQHNGGDRSGAIASSHHNQQRSQDWPSCRQKQREPSQQLRPASACAAGSSTGILLGRVDRVSSSLSCSPLRFNRAGLRSTSLSPLRSRELNECARRDRGMSASGRTQIDRGIGSSDLVHGIVDGHTRMLFGPKALRGKPEGSFDNDQDREARNGVLGRQFFFVEAGGATPRSEASSVLLPFFSPSWGARRRSRLHSFDGYG